MFGKLKFNLLNNSFNKYLVDNKKFYSGEVRGPTKIFRAQANLHDSARRKTRYWHRLLTVNN